MERLVSEWHILWPPFLTHTQIKFEFTKLSSPQSVQKGQLGTQNDKSRDDQRPREMTAHRRRDNSKENHNWYFPPQVYNLNYSPRLLLNKVVARVVEVEQLRMEESGEGTSEITVVWKMCCEWSCGKCDGWLLCGGVGSSYLNWFT